MSRCCVQFMLLTQQVILVETYDDVKDNYAKFLVFYVIKSDCRSEVFVLNIADEDWEVLYHYTSLNAFFSIIKNREFRLTDVTKSNDPLEGQYVLQAIEKAYKKLYQDDAISYFEYIFAHRSFIRLTEEISSAERSVDFCGAASFCIPTHELTMLRCYGDNGRGVALGVPIKALKSLTKNPKIKFKKIRYLSSEEIEKECEIFWYNALKRFEIKSESSEGEPYEELIGLLKDYYREGYFIKNNVNQDEKEFRLLFYDEELFRLWLPMIGEPVDDNIDFSSKDSELKAYYKLPINITESDGFYIQDVLLGPLCKATTNDVQVFLRRYGFNSCNISRQSWVVMR